MYNTKMANDKTKLIALTILVYGVPILLWSTIPFTKNIWGTFTSDFVFNFLFYGVVKYSVMGILFDIFIFYCAYLLLKPEENIKDERVFLISSGIKKIWKWIFNDGLKKDLAINNEEKVSLLFYLVKLYFIPVMLGFLINNTTSFLHFFPTLQNISKTGGVLGAKKIFLLLVFPLMFHLILIIDTVIFVFGYLFEAKALKNIVKSVEPTALGWFVAVMCYPPLNNITTDVLGWYSSDFADFGSVNINLIAGFISIFFFIIYVWASIALGFKASNLTNRGIVSTGPYKYVRHPAYISKNLSWWIMGIPFIASIGFVAIFSLAVWSSIYFMRALTEERHLLQDPDYVEYSKKVKYMFIPGLF
ncbi:MAG: isoprenylcysteine carboxylmethyltransferase family protein [bacterium]